MWHLAETLRGLQRSDEAEPLARRTLQIWEASFGPDHEWTAWALISLAETRLAQGDAGEAAGLAERAASVLQRVFGAEHPVLASTLTLQARARLALDEPDSAEPLLLRALSIHGAATDDGEAAALAEALLADTRARQSRH